MATPMLYHTLLGYIDPHLLYPAAHTASPLQAQAMLSHKRVENWLLWVAVDSIYCVWLALEGTVAMAAMYGMLSDGHSKFFTKADWQVCWCWWLSTP